MITRRSFIRTAVGSLIAAPAGLGFYAWRLEPEWIQVVHRELPIRGLPSELEGHTLLQLSDLHIGPGVDDRYIAGSFRRARALHPDFVVMTGDWITYRGPAVLDRLSRLLDELPRGRLGTVGILGNHDYGYGWRMADVGDQVSSLASTHGIRILRNEQHGIAGLTFVGLEDLWGPHFDPNWRVPAPTASQATLALCHNPDGADQGVWHGYSGWILAGHTHGGQCKPPFLPPPVLPVRNRRYSAGAIRVDDRKMLYINRGIGYLWRVRFNVRPELTLFRLRSEQIIA